MLETTKYSERDISELTPTSIYDRIFYVQKINDLSFDDSF